MKLLIYIYIYSLKSDLLVKHQPERQPNEYITYIMLLCKNQPGLKPKETHQILRVKRFKLREILLNTFLYCCKPY